MSPHSSAFVIEAFANETEGIDFAGLAAHLEQCDACRLQLEAARAARQEFARSILPGTRGAVARRIARWKSWLLAPLVLVPALGLAVVLLLPRPRAADDLRVKGDAALSIFVERGGRVFSVEDGETLRPGDRLRFEVDPGRQPYLLIVSIDAAGHASVYVPYAGSASVAVDPSRRFVSPGSIKLDAVPGPERLFVLLSQAPVAASEAQRALERIRGPEAIRETHRLPVAADAQLSFLWENGGQ